jgi:hypothetical protein
MSSTASERLDAAQEGIAHRVGRRNANRQKAAELKPATDAQGLVEFACECKKVDCEKAVRVPLYVYQRILDSNQYLLQAGHHAFASYRTIVQLGLMRIEERA